MSRNAGVVITLSEKYTIMRFNSVAGTVTKTSKPIISSPDAERMTPYGTSNGANKTETGPQTPLMFSYDEVEALLHFQDLPHFQYSSPDAERMTPYDTINFPHVFKTKDTSFKFSTDDSLVFVHPEGVSNLWRLTVFNNDLQFTNTYYFNALKIDERKALYMFRCTRVYPEMFDNNGLFIERRSSYTQ